MPNRLLELLDAPFKQDRVSWKPQTVRNGKALAVAYIDSRDVQERLDLILGAGWSNSFVVLTNTADILAVECTITIRLPDGTTVSRSDVGTSDNGPRAADRHKSAFSDAFKRAAVQFGVGRHLYDLPSPWMEFDEQGKKFTDESLRKLGAAYNRLHPYRELRVPETEAPASLPPAQQPPSRAVLTEQLINSREAAALHADLARAGVDRAEHLTFAGNCINEPVSSLSHLTHQEANIVRQQAQMRAEEMSQTA